MRTRVLLLSSLLLTASLGHSQTNPHPRPSGNGTITGVVLDEYGQPLPKAEVCREEWQPHRNVGDCTTMADEDGKFQIEHVPSGTYYIIARKQETCYGTSSRTGEPPVVTVNGDQVTAPVVVKVSGQDVTLIPSVTDSVTGKPLQDIWIHWESTRKLPNGSETSAGEAGTSRWTPQVCLPPNKDLKLEISAKGYRTVVYSEPGTPPGSLVRFQPGVKTLELQLEPEAQARRN